MRQTNLSFILAILGLVSWAAGAQEPAQPKPVTLPEAVLKALDKSPDRRLSSLDVAAAQSDSRLARTALLPTLGFSESAARGNDPVYVFGARLRQQRFTQNDFALNALNRPTPIGSFTSRLSGGWTVFDGWRTERQIRHADLLLASTRSAAVRSDQEIVHRVVAGYKGVLLSQKQVEVAEHQIITANALLESTQSRVKAGIAVESDQLAAAANLAARQEDLIAAQGNLEIAWAELERSIGTHIPDDRRNLQPLLPAHFVPPPLTEAIAEAIRTRPDRLALKQMAEADRTGVQVAKLAFAPTVNAFGSWKTDRTSFAGAGGNNWLAGAELRIDILPAARREELAAAKIREQRARTLEISADDQIRLEVTRAWYAHHSASRMVEVSQASVTQSEESLRILRNRYEAGLATLTDLLRGEDLQRQSAAAYWQAVFANSITWADLKFAMGTLLPDNLNDLQ